MSSRFLCHVFAVVCCQALVAIAFTTSVAGQAVKLSPTSVNFGNQTVGTSSPAQAVMLTNTGSATLTFTSIIVSGAERLDFAPLAQLSNRCSKSLAAGATCELWPVFTPQVIGARTATIQITDNAPGSPHVVTLNGNGTAPVASWSVPNLSFGSETVNESSAPIAVTLTNTGNGNLKISNIVASGDYSQTNNCASTIAPNGTCSVSVTFTPSVVWARMGAITVTSNVVAPPLFLSGMGSGGANISLSAQKLTFTNQSVGNSSAAQAVTVRNLASAAAAIASISASGDYTQTNTCGPVLNVSCEIDVTFSPSWNGARVGEVVVNFTDPPMQQVISLTGTGLQPGSTVAIAPRQSSLTPTQTAQFQATISGVISSNVTWSVDGIIGGNSSVGTISTSGLYTPAKTAGAHQIKATSTADSTKSASAPLFVTNNSGVFTQHNDNGRTGQNIKETVLSPANVNKTQFGKLGHFPVDGYIYAQPLYVAGVKIPNQGTHNAVYVATENDSVFAIDADNQTLLWQTSFLTPPSVTPIPATDLAAPGGGSLIPLIGITSTPVIDTNLNAIFVVAATKEFQSGSGTYEWIQRLHALDLASGSELANSPTVIQGSVPGLGAGSSGGNVSFNALLSNQRPGLLLSGGVVYITWGSQNDQNPYHGWVMGYSETTMQQVSVFNVTPNAHGGGVWQSGIGAAADANGNIYLATGNGNFDANLGGTDFGDSYIKLGTAGNNISLTDYFSPYNQGVMNLDNLDLGAGGIALLPNQPGPFPHLLIGGGKTATLYLVNRDNMGGYGPGSDSIVQELEGVLNVPVTQVGLRGGPAYWNGQVYVSGSADYVKAFPLSNGLLSTFPFSQSPAKDYYPGTTPSVSSNGSNNAIVWTLEVGAYAKGNPAILHAYDALNLGEELYNSKMNPSRDSAGGAVKFTVPTVVNGKVFVPTQTELDFYGLLP